MALKAKLIPHTLKFKFDAGTSRGVLREKKTYLLKIWEESNPAVVGIGECGPLAKLSIDDFENLDESITLLAEKINGADLPPNADAIYDFAFQIAGYDYPSLRFAIEVALLDLKGGGQRMIFNNAFFSSQDQIPINGLIWMGHMENMLLQISDKIVEEFDCLKVKVGSLDFEKEVDILNYVRRKYYNQQIMLRVDANGAFKPHEALYKMKTLAFQNIHSIEQPIAAGQHDLMAELCVNPPIDIALDEELIGVHKKEDKEQLLKKIKPQYIIIKPTLLGGFQSSLEWIKIADSMKIGWWITSALESNIGLNAICQFTYQLKAKGHQGLGTGKLYENNFESPLTIKKGHIFYDQTKEWDLTELDDE
ncbi:o-succinylbenzoate synthase [Fulvivirga lutea]|uniref:O-succinylbenzoate synthase n=1 Tax=Fulvivirga lutea TaxID=2810512 RepID=A0A974WDQ3_9BACT|nr:o-succinylbenzoate synthase [Fulvivirga lutea]QSE96269.1 o-succinylbenzoate synthase [Fulvivirga lutea]